jgi:ankyrin repeat protein
VPGFLIAQSARIQGNAVKEMQPIHVAALGGQKEMAVFLIENGADVNAKAVDGWTPLHVAVLLGHTGVAELLRKYGGRE